MKKKVTKKVAAKATKTVKTKKENSSFVQQLLHKKHRPLHIGIAGSLLLFIKGLFAVVGIAIVLVSVIIYIMRAAKSAR